MHLAFRLAVLVIGLSACSTSNAAPVPPSDIHIIPQPVSVTEKTGHFNLSAATHIQTEGDSLATPASWLAERLHLPQGNGGKSRIILQLTKQNANREGYTLNITPSTIRIEASSPAGVFYGIQTLLQLLPPDAGSTAAIPCVEITDYPRFGWRGLMLDVSRHFFT
jgi:hexosaminidase